MNVRDMLRIIVVIALAIGSVASLPRVAVTADVGSISGKVYKEGGTTPMTTTSTTRMILLFLPEPRIHQAPAATRF
jgi:hypothetical protein